MAAATAAQPGRPLSPSEAAVQNRTVLIVGTGRCGLLSLAELLNRQPDTHVSAAESPLLPWRCPEPGRLARMRRSRKDAVIGDAAPFYLPYLEVALADDPNLLVVALSRPREAVAASFARFLDATCSLPTNHWADEPFQGWFHDPLWTPSFPQYETPDRIEGICLYCDEYESRLAGLAARYAQ